MIILEDESVLIEDSFYIVGRSDTEVTDAQMSVEELIKELDHEKPIIMVEHKPIDVESAAKYGADVYLSGHSHGGQIPPIALVENFLFDHVYGLKQVDDCSMIVTGGFGTWNTTIRLEGHSEFVIVNIEGAN